jgi:hypothetical protein
LSKDFDFIFIKCTFFLVGGFFLDLIFELLQNPLLHGIFEEEHCSRAKINLVEMAKHLFTFVFWEFLAINQSLIKSISCCQLKLDQSVVKHHELAVLWLDTYTSENDLRFWIVSSSTNENGD